MKNIIIIFIIFLSSCTSNQSLYTKSSDTHNQLSTALPEDWLEINKNESDFALQNKTTKSIFIFNSSCRKNAYSNLEYLTSSLLAGITELKIIDKKIENKTNKKNEFIEINAYGKLDGVFRYFKIITIQKNNCIYDYILIATNTQTLESDSKDMKFFLQRIITN